MNVLDGPFRVVASGQPGDSDGEPLSAFRRPLTAGPRPLAVTEWLSLAVSEPPLEPEARGSHGSRPSGAAQAVESRRLGARGGCLYGPSAGPPAARGAWVAICRDWPGGSRRRMPTVTAAAQASGRRPGPRVGPGAALRLGSSVCRLAEAVRSSRPLSARLGERPGRRPGRAPDPENTVPRGIEKFNVRDFEVF
jgi:hypothetical protein